MGEELVKATQFQFISFILALEILFIFIKSKPEIEEMTIFDYNYLCSDYKNFFLKNIISVKHMVDNFSYFSGLKPNLTKSKIAGIGVLKIFKWQSVVCVA